MVVLLFFSDSVVVKVWELIEEEENLNFKFCVFVIGGGCFGFQYGFFFDESQDEEDMVVECEGVSLLVDLMSYQYLVGVIIEYQEGL